MARYSAANPHVLFFLRHAEPYAAPCASGLRLPFSFARIGLGRYTGVPLRVPEWRNWQTRGTQNPETRKGRVGSIPTSGTNTLVIMLCSNSASPTRRA
jgi:hypothetical protein